MPIRRERPDAQPRQDAQPGRPTRPALSREYILRSALALVDQHGLEALTMRRLGAELGVDPMTVYHYLPNKAALLDGVAELLWLDGLDIDALDRGEGDRDVDWRTLLERAMLSLRATLLAHPRAVTLPATHPLVTADQLTMLERALGELEQAGLALDGSTLALLNVAGMFTLGHVVAEVGEPAGGAGGEFDMAAVQERATNFPRVVKVLAQAAAEGYDAEAQYRAGLCAILDGWPG